MNPAYLMLAEIALALALIGSFAVGMTIWRRRVAARLHRDLKNTVCGWIDTGRPLPEWDIVDGKWREIGEKSSGSREVLNGRTNWGAEDEKLFCVPADQKENPLLGVESTDPMRPGFAATSWYDQSGRLRWYDEMVRMTDAEYEALKHNIVPRHEDER